MGDRPRRAALARRMLTWVAVGSLLVAVVVGHLPAPTDRLLVLAGTVVRPAPIAWCLVGIAVLLSLVRVLVDSGPPALPRRSWRRILVRFLVVVLSAAAVLSCALASLPDLGSRFLVLDPAGPDGCRVVVAQHSFLLLGSGEIHVLDPGEHRTRKVGYWDADDGYRPFDFDTWSLEWKGGQAELVTRGEGNMPVWPERHELSCSR